MTTSLVDEEIELAFCDWCDRDPDRFGPVSIGDSWMMVESFEAGFLAAKEKYCSGNFDQQNAQQLI